MNLPDLSIDHLALDKEWLGHTNLYTEWGEKCVEAQAAFDVAKANQERTRCSLDNEIRLDPGEYGLVKATDKSVETTIGAQPEYLGAVKGVITARKQMNMTKMAMDALEHRKRALSMLVELWIRDYYSEATANRGGETKTVDKEQVRMERRRKAMERKNDRSDA